MMPHSVAQHPSQLKNSWTKMLAPQIYISHYHFHHYIYNNDDNITWTRVPMSDMDT